MFRRFLPALLVVLAAAAVAPPVARGAEEAVTRLGHDVQPTFQAIHLRLDADQPQYTGSVRVELEVKKSTNTFALHADGQNLTRIVVVQGADTLRAEQEPGEDGYLTLTTAKPLAVGAATLLIDFDAAYGVRTVGLYQVKKGGHGYLFTQFEDTDARKAFPCWDEPGFKFPYQLTLEIPTAHSAVSNTPIEHERVQGAWKTVEFQRTVPLPVYLIAIAAGPLEFTPVPGARIPTRIVTVQGQKQLTGTAVADTPKLLAALERWFGIPYPYAKLDLIAVPDFAYGAMENAGAITYRDDLLLLDPATATVSQRRSLASVNCHELSHMWFGDLVTMAWWDDLWLNESFADWMAAKITDEVFPELQAGLSDLQEVQGVKAGDALPSTVAIREKRNTAHGGLQNVGLVYNKGNAMLSMFESYLGPEVFRRGVQSYLKAHAFGNATAPDLWKALDAASGTNVSASMATFTDQPGLPSVRVVPAPGGVRLTQQRCSPLGISQPAELWRIPIAIKWSDGHTVRTQRVLLDQESQVVALPGAAPVWVMANGGGHGYYAWSAPGPMMARVAKEAQTALTPAERVSFLGNMNLLMAAGEVHGDTYFEVLGQFGADSSPQVLASTMQQLGEVRLALVPDSLEVPFAAYVRRTFGPALERIGYERKPGEDETIGTMRGEMLRWLAGRGEDAKVKAYVLDAARRYLADPSSVDPGIASTVLALAARQGDAALFDEYRRRFESSEIPAIRRLFLGALGGFQDSTLEARALEYSLTDKVQPSETLQLWREMRDRSEAQTNRFFRWVLANYPRLSTRIPPPALRFMPMMGMGCSEARYQATKAFFGDPARGIPGVEQTLQRVGDNVHECLSLREREGAAVEGFLRGQAAR